MLAPSEIKAAVDLLRELYNYVRQTANYDPKIVESLDAVRIKILDAREKEIELLEKIHELNAALKVKTMCFDRNVGAYYEDEENGQRLYYCLRCADADGKRCKLSERYPRGLVCRVCGHEYSTKEDVEKTRRENEIKIANRPRKAIYNDPFFD